MSKKVMVTRTFATTTATLLCLNTETAEPFNTDVTLAGTYADEKKLFNAAKKIVENDKPDVSVCKLVHVWTDEKLYGMTAEDFLAHAEILPPRTATTEETYADSAN